MSIALESPPAANRETEAAPIRIDRDPLMPQAEGLAERVVLLRLSISAWGVNRRLQEHQYEVDANKAMTRAGKRLLVSPELQAVYTLDGGCRDWVASRSLPSQMKKGTYLQPLANLLDVDAFIVDFMARRETMVETFLEAYPRRVLEARQELRSLFDPKSYPTARALKERFRVNHEYLELASAPGSLKALSGELFAREQRKIERQWQEALEEARCVLRTQMASLVEHMVDRLSPGEDGKPRVFRNSLVGNLEEWLETFSARNLSDDAELARLVSQAKGLLHGREEPVTADVLRTDTALRERLQEDFSVLKEQLDSLVVQRPGRRIRLDD